ANGLATGAGGQRLESVLDAARRYFSIFARSETLRAAMATSDWNPLDLRRKPGTTVYIVIPDTDLKAYAPIVRLLFYQHLRLLKPQLAKPDDPPITFFLDEMPQLGKFESILTLQDTGRGSGLRLWMFAQTVGQIHEAYGRARGEGLIGGARIRTYLQPDQQTADTLSKALGQTRQFFSGEKKPLASVDELMGRAYADQVIVQSRADFPAKLQKQLAHATLGHLMRDRPPVVPKLNRATP
ncbi:MAG: type IV secretory system conjugative DNA transfer family protein, partial [Beijerinckiaceae bacterium]